MPVDKQEFCNKFLNFGVTDDTLVRHLFRIVGHKSLKTADDRFAGKNRAKTKGVSIH